MRRKVLAAALAAVILALGLCSCGDNQAVETKPVDPAAAAETLVSAIPFQDTLSKLDDDVVMRLYGVDDALVESSAVYVSSGATAEEVAVFQCKDDAAADELEKAVRARIEERKQSFENYQPAELTKLDEAQVVKQGVYVVFVAADDASLAAKEIKNVLG